ncbi:TRAP transporter small permease [Vibrio brasiliensis]|uniref:TRAP transporter small permease n=1 Tax=Vibrio oreintalis group TaxID=1891919 RepID=UPI001EFD47D4|nr:MULTISPECIES: TRAP transporter small permease [Vibrio oreintalis group]MCG9579592.1 TRAP transporter small permease [Vibrio tubiashii]MCG9753140.1 TRAP transporter small permease [Vibrio brasiliensis]
MKNLLHKISIATEKLERFLIISATLSIMLNSTANAIGRYAFNKSLYFAEELNQFLIVSVTFIGFAYAVRQGRNIRMTAVYDVMSFKFQKILTTIISLLTGMLMFYLAYHAILYVQELKSINRLSPALEFPVYWVYTIIPIGFTIAGLQYSMSFLMNLLNTKIYVSFDIIENNKLGKSK